MLFPKLTDGFQGPRQPAVGAVASADAVEGAAVRGARLLSIDAVRGTAMLFVGISHIRYYVVADDAALAALLRWLGYLASPTFLLISGLACGYQFSMSTSRATAMRIFDRGLFVLLVGHVLVCGSLVYEVAAGTVFEHVVITDSIGLFLCLSPLIRHASGSRLILAGGVLFLLTSAVALDWQPSTLAGEAIGGALFSIDAAELHARGWVTPTLAYLALFMSGVGVGKLIGEYRSEWGAQTLATSLMIAGMLAVSAGIAANVVEYVVKPTLLQYVGNEQWVKALLQAADVRHDAPPTPAYALFYGGIGLAGIGAVGRMLAYRAPGLLTRPVHVVTTFGRASFVSYVCIQWLVDFLPHWTGLNAWLTPGASLLYLVLVMFVVFLIARAWDRRGANRYLTVGLTT